MRDLTPKPAEWIDRAPVKFRASREIAATPEEVWSALCDHERWPVWFSALSGAGATGGEGIGSTRFVMVGKDRIDETFVIWDEPRSWGFTVDRAEGPIGRIGASLNERVEAYRAAGVTQLQITPTGPNQLADIEKVKSWLS